MLFIDLRVQLYLLLNLSLQFDDYVNMLEIRGAPHMDSLVSIYKNMEDASGIKLFVSQNNPSPSGT